MCGIVGYIGRKSATDVLISGLKRLEYRGYDSAGIVVVEGGKLHTVKQSGKGAYVHLPDRQRGAHSPDR